MHCIVEGHTESACCNKIVITLFSFSSIPLAETSGYCSSVRDKVPAVCHNKRFSATESEEPIILG